MNTIVVIVMTILTFLFNLQIQLSAAVSSAIFSHIYVMKFVKEEKIFYKKSRNVAIRRIELFREENIDGVRITSSSLPLFYFKQI